MPLITEEEMVKTFKLDKFGNLGMNLAKQMMNFLKIREINYLFDRFSHLEGLAFIDAILNYLNIEVDISDFDLKRIPKKGPFIIVANHPLGGIDGLILLKIMLQHHPESKILANFLLKKVTPISEYICAVNPFEERKEIFSSSSGLRQAISHLSQGLPLGIFPAGEVSVKSGRFSGMITDKAWDISAIKFIKKAKVPVVPVYFHAKNSEFFYVLAGINASLRTAKLPSELINSKNKKIVIRIGQPISPDCQDLIPDIHEYGNMLRHKTQILSYAFQQKNIFRIGRSFRKSRMIPVSLECANHKLSHEIKSLENTQALILESNDYKVFFTKFTNLPETQREIGRLRELTFRAVGEGTNQPLDLDRYDEYYYHLILWDNKAGMIAGAYRMGLGEEIFPKYGMQGFYLSELFHLSGSMHQFFHQSIEIGRAFVCIQYQQRPMPLFLLWRGIVNVTKRYSNYKYLVGAASISNSYCEYSKSLLIEYLRMHHFDHELSHNVAPKRHYKSILKTKDRLLMENLQINDIKSFDKIIGEIEPHGLRIPVLIKKYLLQNAKMLGFNVDSAFNYAIDGLMYISTSDIDMEKFG